MSIDIHGALCHKHVLGWLLQVRGGTSAQAAAQAAATTISRAVATAIASASAKVTTSGKRALTTKAHTIPTSAQVYIHRTFAGSLPLLDTALQACH